MNSRYFQTATLLFLIAIWIKAFSSYGSDRHPWPKIEPVTRNFHFADANQASVSLSVRSPEGRSLYWFGCHSADFAGKPSDPFHDDEWFYYGIFDCHLHYLGDKNGYNLMSYDGKDPRENFSRALTMTKNLQGRCAEYPEWGLVRHIRVRGMRITLEFTDLQFGKETAAVSDQNPEGIVLQSFSFNVTVERDNEALSAFAEPPKFAYPLRTLPGSRTNISDDCAKVIPEPSQR